MTKDGLFEFVRMPFALCNSPATYSRAMEKILNGLTWKTALALLDDIMRLGKISGGSFPKSGCGTSTFLRLRA